MMTKKQQIKLLEIKLEILEQRIRDLEFNKAAQPYNPWPYKPIESPIQPPYIVTCGNPRVRI